MFSSSIKKRGWREVGYPGLSRGLHGRCVAEWGGSVLQLVRCRAGGAGVSFTRRRRMSELHFYQSRGVWYRMSHTRLQWKLGKVLVVADAFLLHFLPTVHSMRTLKGLKIIAINKLRNFSVAPGGGIRAPAMPDDSRESSLKVGSFTQSPGSCPLWHDGGRGLLAERCTRTEDISVHPVLPPSPVSASSKGGGAFLFERNTASPNRHNKSTQACPCSARIEFTELFHIGSRG